MNRPSLPLLFQSFFNCCFFLHCRCQFFYCFIVKFWCSVIVVQAVLFLFNIIELSIANSHNVGIGYKCISEGAVSFDKFRLGFRCVAISPTANTIGCPLNTAILADKYRLTVIGLNFFLPDLTQCHFQFQRNMLRIFRYPAHNHARRVFPYVQGDNYRLHRCRGEFCHRVL